MPNRTCACCGVDINHKYTRARYCTKQCRDRSRPNGGYKTIGMKNCEQCGNEFEVLPKRRTHCSVQCSSKTNGRIRSRASLTRDHRIARLQSRGEDVVALPWASCVQCRGWFVARCGRRLCRTDECVRARTAEAAVKYYHSVKDSGGTPSQLRRSHRVRAAKASGTYEPYEHTDIFERDNWRCVLCHKKINPKLQWPHPGSQSIDHIVPLSQGGDDAPHNVTASHLGCNIAKGNRPQGEQLRLVG